MKSLIFISPPKEDTITSYYSSFIDNIYRINGFKKVIVEIYKFNKNIFLNVKQKRNLKLFFKKNF